MKNYIQKTTSGVLLATAFAFIGCESLDQDPYLYLNDEKAFNTLQDADSWHNGFYNTLRDISYGDFYTLPDTQSDLLNMTTIGSGAEDHVAMHTWNFLPSNQRISNVWFKRYNAIAILNKCIAKFPTISVTEDYQKASLNYYLGDAYAFRAYHFFQLVEKFSPAYSNLNKNTPNLGVPLVLQYDVYEKPARATLEENYNQILSDIANAERYLSADGVSERVRRVLDNDDFDINGHTGANYFTLDALKALKARVLFNMQNYSEAFEIAKNLTENEAYELISSENQLKNMWHNDFVNESIMQLTAIITVELPQSNDLYLQFLNRNYRPSYVPTQWIIDLYEEDDYRKKVYFLKDADIDIAGRFYKSTLVNKYPGNPALFSGLSNYAHRQKIFRIAEFYLIAAESAFMTGNSADAAYFLNALRASRGLSDIASPTLSDIKDERTREMAFEGGRINDLKRWGDGLKLRTPQNTAYIVTNPSNLYQNLQRNANDFRFVWPIPFNDIRTNRNITQNTGY